MTTLEVDLNLYYAFQHTASLHACDSQYSSKPILWILLTSILFNKISKKSVKK